MSLLDDVNAALAENESFFDYYDLDAEEVHSEVLDQRRWYDVQHIVLKRGDEHVGVRYCTPSTEMQEGNPHDGEAFVVEPYEKTITAYRRVQ